MVGARIKIVFSLSLILPLLLQGCLPDPLEVRALPVVKPEIVLSSQIVPDQGLVVLLTRTFGALDASDDSDPQEVLDQIAVNDALVILKGPGVEDTLISFGSGTYGSVTIPFEEGQEYTLEVNSESLGKVTATTRVLPQVRFNKVEVNLYFDSFDDTLAQVVYDFNDPPEKNFYMINVLEIDSSSITENLLNPRDFTRILDDAKFGTSNYGEVFRVFPREFDKGDTVAVYLSNISEDYYRFLKIRLDNRFNFTEFLSEPVNYPTNVVGGKGFFNLYLPDIRFFVLE